MTFNDLSAGATDHLRESLFSFIDTKLLLGYRYNEFVYGAPSIEDANAVQGQAANEFGQAHHFSNILSSLEVNTAEREQRTSPSEFASMDELDSKPESWPVFLASVGFADLATQVRLQSFTDSDWEPVAKPAEKAVQEEEFHTQYLIGTIMSYILPDKNATDTFNSAFNEAFPAILRWFGRETNATSTLVEENILGNTPDTERKLLMARVTRLDEDHFDSALSVKSLSTDDLNWSDWNQTRFRTSGGPEEKIVAALSTQGIESSIGKV